MARAAFLFSGQLRGFPHCIRSMKEHLFSSFDEIDTFFYIPEVDGRTLYENWMPTSAVIEKDQYHAEVEGFENSITSSENKIAANGYATHGRMQHYYLQWYGVKRVFELFDSYRKVNDVKYDTVFRIRTDFKFHKTFHWEDFDGIQIPAMLPHGGIYDRLAFGPVKYMRYYCSIYDKIKAGHYKQFVNLGNSESKLMQHLTATHIPIKYVHMSYDRINKDGTIQDDVP
jgi:hypothetical protein